MGKARSMTYQVKILESVEKELKKMDKQTVRVIKNWIVKNLVDTEDPRAKGKPLTHSMKGLYKDCRHFAILRL